MKTYSEWGESSADWQMFEQTFRNMTDIGQLRVFSDWLEERGFPEVADLIRSRITKGGRISWPTMSRELRDHGMVIHSNDILRLTPGNNTAAGQIDFKMTHSQILMHANRGWVPIDKPYPEAIPGLAVLMVSSIQNTGGDDDHPIRILLSFLGRYSNELRAISERLEGLVDRGIDLTPRFTREVGVLSSRIAQLVEQIQKTGQKINSGKGERGSARFASDWHPFENLVNSILHAAMTIQQMLQAERRQVPSGLRNLINALQHLDPNTPETNTPNPSGPPWW
jgi:hypothetical protein